MSQTIRELAHERIIEKVIKKVKTEEQWKILVLDALSTRVISSVCRMYDIMDYGVTLVENIERKRKPFRQFEAIYLVSPTEKSVLSIIDDFIGAPMYKKAHIFFTSMCPDHLFKKISSHPSVVKMIGTLEELYLEFLPVESQAFTLDLPSAFHSLYSPHSTSLDYVQRRIAEQIATFCATIGENPVIRYSAESDQSASLASLVQAKIDQYAAAGAISTDGRPRAQLLLVDRGFDVTSPLLHELTYQAMAYDLLPINSDVFLYEYASSGRTEKKEVILGEQDFLWADIRHHHIAETIREVTDGLKKFTSTTKTAALKNEKVSVAELSAVLKEMPQHQEQLQRYSLHIHIAEKCMQYFKELQIESIAMMEQNIVMGEDAQGVQIKNLVTDLVPILQDPKITIQNKLRLLMIYIITKGGVTEADRDKFLEHAGVPSAQRKMINNLQYLNVPVSTTDKKAPKSYPRRKREHDESYALSRWIPVLKDILLDANEDKLDKRFFASVRDEDSSASDTSASSARSNRTNWAKGKEKETKPFASSSLSARKDKSGPRIIAFIVGGMTYSEMRAAYEVNEKSKREILIGSTSIITPTQFLSQLITLDKPFDGKTDSVVLEMGN